MPHMNHGLSDVQPIAEECRLHCLSCRQDDSLGNVKETTCWVNMGVLVGRCGGKQWDRVERA